MLTEEKPNENTTNPENDDIQKILSGMRALRILNIWYVRFFMLLFFAVFIFALIIPLRPKYSESEKRELEKFPKLTLSSFFSGDYFDGINSWYSDTFPLRDTLTDINAGITELYGISSVKIHGTVENADEIPEQSETADSNVSSAVSSSVSADTVSSESSEAKSEPSSTQQTSSAQTAPPAPPAPTSQTLGAMLIAGDTAYEYYNFVKATADSYTAAVNRAAALLNGKAAVYNIIIPTSISITAPESIVAGIKTSDQQKAINYMYSNMQGVKTVPLFDTFKSHKNEYIYFRTDHHWTALGAYYAYCELMKAKGLAPTPLESFKRHEFAGYLGSFYTQSKKLPQLAANPDTVYAYEPKETNLIDIQYRSGAWKQGQPIISDMSAVPSKYLTFIKGDNPFGIIKNPTLTDNSACIVIKESFGNAFVPFLVAHYQTIYVVDYRYFNEVDSRGLLQLTTDTKSTDVIFINNISATRNKALMQSIGAFVK